MAEATNTKIITGIVRLSFLRVFEPKAIEGSADEKYSVSVIIPKDAPFLKDVEAAIAAAKEDGKKNKWGGKIPPKLKMPLNDGDVEKPEYAEYENSFFLNATSKNKPGLLKRVGGKNVEIINPDELYSGCYGLVCVNFYAFDKNGNRGVAAGLNSVLKIKDGEPLGGRGNALADFDEVDVDQYMLEAVEDDDTSFL